jgi:hypothetical protein
MPIFRISPINSYFKFIFSSKPQHISSVACIGCKIVLLFGSSIAVAACRTEATTRWSTFDIGKHPMAKSSAENDSASEPSVEGHLMGEGEIVNHEN